MQNNSIFSNTKSDMLAGLVVFLVALPLCLGIASSSGAVPFAGIITGIVGGIVVGLLSSSNVSVSGPAAGLIAIIQVAITGLTYETFLVSVILAGVIQLILGFIKAGTISNYFPSGVIEGMLVAIGIIIVKKELPHAIGYDKEIQGDFFSYKLLDTDKGFFSELLNSFNFAHLGAIVISIISIAILFLFNKSNFLKKIKFLPGALVVVIIGIVVNQIFKAGNSNLTLGADHLVKLPVINSASDFFSSFAFPNFTNAFTNAKVWETAFVIAIIASIETLLCLEAGDKLDPLKRFSSGNKELKAQGIGNIICGLIGGLPMTSVIVRTSANINAGGRSKLSAIFHGVLLLISVLLLSTVLNLIPRAALAGILIMIGLKLASIGTFKHMWHAGKFQFIPFIVTVVAVVFTDLLKGVGIGLVVSIIFLLRGNMKLAYFFKKKEHADGDVIHIDLAQEVSFLNKAAIKQTLAHLPKNAIVVIDAKNTVYIDYDVLELIRDFVNYGAKDKNINVTLKDFKDAYKMNDVSNVHSEKE